MQANTTYKFRIHACNGDNSCGWWTDPPREVTTPPEPTTAPTATAAPAGIPHAPHSLRYTDRLATSFTFHWRPHANTGGRPLTGFGILRWEKPGDRPSDSEATVVGAGSRSQPVTGLTYGREQRVRIRACNGTNRCSAWSSELTVPAMAGLLPTIALPKTSIEIGEQISVGANDVPVGAVAWLRFEGPIQPRGRCGASGTARAPAVLRDPSPSTGPGYYDSAWIEGCAPGGDAVIRLESQDGSVLYDKRTLRVVAASAPGQVGRPIVTPYNASLHVDWEPPTTGGTPTHYDLQYREGTSGDWTLVENITRTSYTITELTNGTSYRGAGAGGQCYAGRRVVRDCDRDAERSSRRTAYHYAHNDRSVDTHVRPDTRPACDFSVHSGGARKPGRYARFSTPRPIGLGSRAWGREIRNPDQATYGIFLGGLGTTGSERSD